MTNTNVIVQNAIDELKQAYEFTGNGYVYSALNSVLAIQQKLSQIDTKISETIEIANNLGGFDGGHHKMFAIDQMVRCLTDCLKITVTNHDVKGIEYTYENFGESEQYLKFISKYNAGSDGPDTYAWDIGIAP